MGMQKRNNRIYSPFILDNNDKEVWEKDNLLNKCSWDDWMLTRSKMTLDPYLIPPTTLTQNGSCDNEVTKTMKRAEENIRKNHWDLGLGKYFLDVTIKTQSIQEKKKNKINCISPEITIYTHPLEWPRFITLTSPSSGQDMEQQKFSFTDGESEKW